MQLPLDLYRFRAAARRRSGLLWGSDIGVWILGRGRLRFALQTLFQAIDELVNPVPFSFRHGDFMISAWHAACTDSQRIEKGGVPVRVILNFIFLVFFFVLIGVWLLAWAAFKVAGGFIHILLLIAAISLIIHLLRPRRTI
jgi:hypothetical protein